jgi:FkbM family methyltransferase
MLALMIAWFDNWREVWRCYRSGTELPPLRFRRGLVLRHRPEDQPLLQFLEVFRLKNYRRYVTEPRRGTVIDIGANIGVVTLDWADRLPNLRIHAYEPHPATYAMLRENTEANHATERIATYEEAVGGRTGTLVLRTSGLSMETSGYGAGVAAPKLDEISVAMVALDKVVERGAGDGPIALAKIDAEGAEVDILESARLESLREIRQFVIEYHNHLYPNALERCERLLTGAGFRCVARPANRDQGLLYAWCDRARA